MKVEQSVDVRPRLVDSWASLPRAAESALQERSWFDVKRTYSPKAHAEMAKDVAAFANSLGGVLIVGAAEGSTEPDYSGPLARDRAEQMEHEFDQAVRDFCRPSPTVHVRLIPVPGDSSKVVVAVNVEPTIDQPIAARHDRDPNFWRFPLRVGRHTEYLLPDHLPGYMDSKARRSKLLLIRALEGGGQIQLHTVVGGSWKHGNLQSGFPVALQDVDEDGGGSFTVRDESGALGMGSVAIPIDDVEAVWLTETEDWAVRVSGRLEELLPFDAKVPKRAIYTPTGTFVVSPLGPTIEDLSKRISEIRSTLRGTLVVQQHVRLEPTDEAIAERAYLRWQLRMEQRLSGSPEDDWRIARKQLLSEQRED